MSPEEVQAYASIIDGLGTLGVLVLVIVGVLTGRVVTRSHHDEVVSVYKRLLEEANDDILRLTKRQS